MVSLFLRCYHVLHIDVEIPTTIPIASKSRTSSLPNNNEDLPIFVLPPALFPKDPAHLTAINPSFLIPRGIHPSDIAHRNGLLHEGHVLFVMDSSGLFLFLKRAGSVVTCPNTWSVLGEHSIVGESVRESVVRALEEELGLVATTATESTNNVADEGKIMVSIQNVTQFPLYYIRHYGARNDNRIDRQLTYIWLVRLSKQKGEIRWKFDEEVADHKWISLKEFDSWLIADDDEVKDADYFQKFDDAKSVKKEYYGRGGGRDDGPLSGDFCHGTIRSLYRTGLDHLKLMLNEEMEDSATLADKDDAIVSHSM